jgi:hypothetical protein
MIYVEAPTPYQRAPGDGPSLFLADGITACPDWQSDARTLLTDAPIVLLNPRRRAYNPANGDTAEQQIAWEYHHLHLADLTLFWFPRCDPHLTVQPITLLELGTALAEARLEGRLITIGADPNYPRRHDPQLQLQHALPTQDLHSTLLATTTDALRALKNRSR